MTEEYRYRPPFKYLFVGIGGLLMSIIFGMTIGKNQIWFSIVMTLFCLMTLALGVGFLILFFRKFNVGKLKVGDGYIEIPGRWKNRVRLDLHDVLSISEFDTYDNVIEIRAKQGVHLIERNWMRQKDFDKVKLKLQKHFTEQD